MARLKATVPGEGIPQLNLTPMIDVCFQLLIFFMVGMQIRVPEGILRAYLPKDRGDGRRPKDDSVPPPDLRIRLMRSQQLAADGQVKVDIFFEQYQCDSIEDLGNKLIRLGQELASIPVVIDGQPDVPFRFILGTLNACVKAKFTDISFKAPPPELSASQ